MEDVTPTPIVSISEQNIESEMYLITQNKSDALISRFYLYQR